MRRIRAPWVAALALLAALPATADDVAVAVPDLRAAILRAYQQGQLATADALTARLLGARPEDPLGLQVSALIARDRGQLPQARAAVRAAFAAAQSDRQRHEAARLAAEIAAAEGRDLALRYWLRQAGSAAPTPAERQAAAAALRQLREMSAWEGRLQFSLSPSNNVNGGSDSPFNLIDGRPEIGMLSEDAQALEGVIATLQADGSLRLARSTTTETRLTFGLDAKRVRMSDAARDRAETLTDGDLAETTLSLGLDHSLATARPGGVWRLNGALGLGESGDSGNRSASIGLAREQKLDGRNTLGLALDWTVERPTSAGARTAPPADHGQLAGLRPGGTRLGLSFSAYAVETSSGQRRRHGAMVQASLAPARALGPVTLSTAVGASFAFYPDFRVGIIVPEGGRQDETVFAQISAVPTDVNWAGFAPQVTLRASRTDSNISAFDLHQIGVVFGVKSLF
ncbi:hypothetical protein ACFSHQ_19475 [Gemmobacter lanyuensis]